MRFAFVLASALAAAFAVATPSLSLADEFTDTVDAALEAYRAGDIATASEDLDYAVKLLASARAAGLAAFLPEPAEGWTREAGEDGSAAMAILGGGVTASAVYRRGDEDFALTLIANSPMVATVASMLGGLSSLPGTETRRIKRQVFAVTDGQIQGVVDDRVLISTEGSATQDDMFAAIERIDFDALKDF